MPNLGKGVDRRSVIHMETTAKVVTDVWSVGRLIGTTVVAKARGKC